ncbi:hypothetical protein [Lysobacter gummosus]|uniref:hypothetical protein n=1 Tax=Lysobacter gummosus TaxID=262324 RepID=UPI003632A2CC
MHWADPSGSAARARCTLRTSSTTPTARCNASSTATVWSTPWRRTCVSCPSAAPTPASSIWRTSTTATVMSISSMTARAAITTAEPWNTTAWTA